MNSIYLMNSGAVSMEQWGFKYPIYMAADEIVNLIKIAIREVTGKAMESVRTLESGIVEEHAVIEKNCGRKTLVVRLWPVFYSHDKRIEYKIYTENPEIQQLIRYYLNIYAKTNAARLVTKG